MWSKESSQHPWVEAINNTTERGESAWFAQSQIFNIGSSEFKWGWCNFRVNRYTIYSFAGEMRNLGVSLCDKKILLSLCLREIRLPAQFLSLHCLELGWWLTGKSERHKTNFVYFFFKYGKPLVGLVHKRALGGEAKRRFHSDWVDEEFFWDFSKSWEDSEKSL